MSRGLTQADLLSLAGRALAQLECEGQVTVCWERAVEAGEQTWLQDRVWAQAVCVDGGRRAVARTTSVDDEGLRALARAAAPLAGPRGDAALPDPAPGRPHDAWDASVAAVDLPGARARASELMRWRAGAARTAIVSTRGVRAYEQRSFAEATAFAVRADGETVSARAAAPGLDGIDAGALGAEAAILAGEGVPLRAEPGETPAVLGPEAVATVLESLKPALVADLEPPLERGRRVAPASVNLSDASRSPGTLARSYDAEGMPRRPVALIRDGVAHGLVGDSASARVLPGAEATGHARVAAVPSPWPDHLILTGGDAETLAELVRPVEHGLYIPALEDLEADADGWSALTDGALAVEDGRFGTPVCAAEVNWEPLAVLEAVQALTVRRKLVIAPAHPHFDEEPTSARTVGATLAPSLRCGAGLRVLRA